MKKKRKAMALWKVILITISSIIGLIGVTVLALYIKGDFNDNPIYPESGIFFVLDGNEKYNQDLGVLETAESFSLTLSTPTEDVNRKTVKLSLPTGTRETIRENGYLDNGIIRVPETVQLDRAFTVELSTSPTDNHIAGGLTSITATSTYPTIDPQTVYINVDVPVESIEVFYYDAEDATKEPLKDIFVGSYFNVGVNYSPERSEKVFGREETKYVFYDFTTNNLEFDYISQTFHAIKVSNGAFDDIEVRVFSNSEYEKEFLAGFEGNPSEFKTQEEYIEFNTAALNFMKDKGEASYKTATISNIAVKEISVNSFVVSNENFNAKVDKKFNLALNSALPEFDGNLGVVIRDEEENILNSVYAGGVGIALCSNNEYIDISGGEVLEVAIRAIGDYNEENGTYSYIYSYDSEGNLEGATITRMTSEEIEALGNFTPNLPEVTADGEEVEVVYYFFLPSRNVGAVAGNYNYSLSSSATTSADFIVALFLEKEGNYQLFLAENQKIETLSHINVTFENSIESDISWKEGTDILKIVYDSDSNLSDSIELSELINLPAENVYQTTRYFLMFENGASKLDDFNAIALGNEYSYTNGKDFNITVPGGATAGNNVYLYELPSTNLSALSGYDKTLYLVFATVRTNANGEIVLNDGKYQIMMISDVKSLEIEATIPLEQIASSLSLTSTENEIYLDNNQILLPSVLAEEETFKFIISTNEGNFTQLRDLYNAGDLRIEFRQTANGEVVDFIVASSDITASKTELSGNIVVYENFNNIEGVSLTPYLVYNNGKRVQEREITIDYGGARNSFTLYKQSVADAEYSFMTDLAEGASLPTTELKPISVEFNLTTRTISWPDEAEAIELEELNNRLSVILYDTKGKVIRTNVASYTLTEEPVSGDRVITIINNAISQFLSTDGKEITTTVKATYRNAGMADSAELDAIYFTVQSEGVSKIEYDSTDGATPPTEDQYVEFSTQAGGTIKIEKYLIDDSFISMSNLVRVYRKNENGEDQLIDEGLKFTLNRADMTGFDTKDFESLFYIQADKDLERSKNVTNTGITNGIIKLGNERATSETNIDDELVASYTDPIYSFKMISALAKDVRLVFDITDDSGLVNLKLELTLKKNIDYSPLLETYANEKGYSDYLLYGDDDEIRIFGAEGTNTQFSLDTYLKVFNVKNGKEGATTWNGNLYVKADTGIVVPSNGENESDVWIESGGNILFKDVTKRETGSATFYYKGENPYGLSITIEFVLSPNYAYVQSKDYIDLTGSDGNLSEYYVLYRATDLIDYIRGGSDIDEAPTPISKSPFKYSDENSLIHIELSDGTITRIAGKNFEASLGATVSNDIPLAPNRDDAPISEEAYALMFKLADDSYELLDKENKFVSDLPFNVGYGGRGAEGVNTLLNSIINSTSSTDYRVLATSTGYELVLLEGGGYDLVDWTYEYQGTGLGNTGDNQRIQVQSLNNFNINGELTFINTTGNNVDKIKVATRLTKIGLEYVVYSENYPYNIITGTMSDLVENNIKEDIEAGKDVLQVLYFNASDEDLTKKPGFHLISSDNTSHTTYNLSIEQVTEGYENLITITSTGSYPDINDAIKLNSMIDINKDVYAVLKLTLTITTNGGQQSSTDIFYRIRITPNYTFVSDVTYPYNNSAEYITSFIDNEEGLMFNVDFEEKFTSQNASLSVAGKTRFPDVKDIDNDNIIGELNYIYTIYSVKVNDEELSDYSAYLSFNLDKNEIKDGYLVGTLTELGRNAIIEVKVARTIENVANSEKVYTLILNNSPSYDATIVNTENSKELEEDENGNFNDNITVGKGYTYSITLLQNEGDIQTPVVSGVNAHITSDDSEKFLKPFLRETSDDNQIYAYTFSGTAQSILDTSAFENMTVEDLLSDAIVGKVTLSMDEYKLVTTTSDEKYYIKIEDIRYFTFTQQGSQYNLSFTTVASIEEDASFSIGVYTAYANIFDIVFNLDGGYDIKFRDKLSGSFESGYDYNISSFIESVKLKADDIPVDIDNIGYVVTTITTASNVVYDNASETFVASDFILITDDNNSNKVFRVAGFNEDFTALITATIENSYSFTFEIKFSKSFDNSVIEKTSTLKIYAQDSNVLNVKDGDIYDALSVFKVRKYLNDGLEGASLSEIDEFTFLNGNTEYEFTAENVAEIENFVLDLTLSYSFGGKEMFTFTIEYNYTVLPNVDLSFNYPNPENLEKTTFTSEYVDNNETIDNYFNSAPKFSKPNDEGEVDNRVSIEKIGQGDYYYDIAIYVEEINNAVLTVNNTTTISSAGLVGSVTNRTGEMPNYSFKFSLNNLSQVGTITFSIVVNEVTDYYYVTINNNNNVTVETNATNLVENEYERIYVEDIAGSTDSYLYSLDRMLKYEFSEGAGGSYYLRFENGIENFVHEVVVEDTGIVVVEDLGRSYTGFSLQGVYSSEEDAENRTNVITDTSSIFLVNPYLTNRIVLKYAGYVVSKDVANIYLQDKTGTKQMEEVEINKVLNNNQKFNIFYQYSYNESAQYSTNSTYTTKLSVKFDVTSSVQNHYEEIITGQDVSLLSLTGFGITNTETGEIYTASDIQANNAYLTLQIYGFSDNKIVGDLEALHNDLISGTALVAQGQRFETGLIPRYGMPLNDASGSITSNYLTLTTVGSAQRPNDYKITAQGAGNIGNFVAMKLTYTTTVGENSYSESADLLFKVLPAYQVEFTAESSSGGTVYGNDMMIGNTNYSTNSSNNPFNIVNADTKGNGKTGQFYLYSTTGTPVLRVYRINKNGTVTDNTNLSNRFTYTFRVNAESGYNTYETGQGLSLSWGNSITDNLGTYYKTNTTFSFTANKINIGARYYYIDAVDSFGYNIRFYFVIRAEINPVVQEVNTYDVKEGDVIQIGAQYRTVTMQQGTVTADHADDGIDKTKLDYYFAYELHNVGINRDAPEINELGGGDYELAYYYVDRQGESHLTDNYDSVSADSADNSATLYLNTAGMSNTNTSKIFSVTYNNATLSPLHSDSEYNDPGFNKDKGGLNVTLSGFEAYTFYKPEKGVAIPYIEGHSIFGKHTSNVNDVQVASISFEYNGKTVETLSGSTYYNSEQSRPGNTDKIGSKSLITTENYMIDNDNNIITGWSAITSDNKTTYTVPTLPGYLYGTSMVVDGVTMVIRLEKIGSNPETDYAELRINLNVSRSQQTNLTKSNYLDTDKVDGTSFGDKGTVYNDTLEIELEPNAEVSYAISTKDTTPSKSEFKTLKNNRNYTHVEYVRISTIGTEGAKGKTYYVHIDSSEKPDGVTFRYGGSTINVNTSNTESLTGFTLDTISGKPITLRIESASELNSQNYTTRNFYTIIEENEEDYHNNHSVRLYTLANSITTTAEYGVSNYYSVTDDNDNTYYVISASSWASGLSYSSGNEGGNLSNPHSISSRPYYYSYSINTDGGSARGASVDKMGTITTGTNFNIQTNYIEVDVTLHVAGADGLFEDEVGIELGTVRFHLNVATGRGMELNNATGIYALGSNALVTLNGDTVQAFGSASTDNTFVSSLPSRTIVVPAGEKINFADYLSSTGSNSSFRIVKENANDSYSNWNNEDSHTYSNSGQYKSVYVESYVSETGINYKVIEVTVIAYNKNNVERKALAVDVNGGENKTLGALLGGTVYLAEDVDAGVFGDSALSNGADVTEINLTSTTSKVKTIKVISVIDYAVNYYEVTLLFYSTTESYDVALTSRTNYDLFTLFENASSVYAINNNNKLVDMKNESLTETSGLAERVYYVVDSDGKVTKYEVTYYIYNSSENQDAIYWYHGEVTREEVIASILGDEHGEGYDAYTLYQLASNNKMTKLDNESSVKMGELNDNRANINFLLATKNEQGKMSYKYYIYTFYYYTASATFDVATSYSSGYALSNLNDLVTNHFNLSMIGSASWYVFENGDIISQPVVELTVSIANNGVITKAFYVNINNTYYLVEVNFYCSLRTYNDTMTTNDYIDVESLKGRFNELLGITESGTIYEISDDNSITELTSSITPPSDDTSAVNSRLLYRVTVDGTTNNYIFNMTILKDERNEIKTEYVFNLNSATLGTSGEISLPLSSVRAEIASKLNILQRNLELSTEDGVNIVTYTFEPSEPIINYDYFFVKLIAKDKLNTDFEKTIYILAKNTINIRTNNLTIIINNFNGSSISANTLKEKINAGLGWTDVKSSALYLIENDRANVKLSELSVSSTTFVLRKEFYYEVENSAGSITRAVISATIVGYPTEDVIGEKNIVNVDYSVVNENGTVKLNFDKDMLHAKLSTVIGTTVDSVKNLTSIEDSYQVEISGDGDYAFMVKAVINSQTDTPEERNVIILALNVEVEE